MTVVMHLSFSQFCGLLMPYTSCLHGKGIEKMCTAGFDIYSSAFFRATLLATTLDVIGVLTVCNSADVSGTVTFLAISSIRLLAVVQHQTDWFLDCRHLCSLYYSQQDVAQMTVTLLSCELMRHYN